MRESHVQPTSEQMSHEHFASSNGQLRLRQWWTACECAVSRPMTSANFANHAAMNNNTAANNNNRPAYNANNLNHQTRRQCECQ